ncbi:hypothetical protein [Leucobacter chromiireducens]|uniref:hypothetical protein n=1 Tax=Leucobacter chromiireducens TaxID=283877 RepID=UPI000F641C22|nr:hypothetical protein [Leucobacter chromiireducens]
MSSPDTPVPGAPPAASESTDGLLSRVELIEAQPLPERAAGFEQLHDELLTELQRGDLGDA